MVFVTISVEALLIKNLLAPYPSRSPGFAIRSTPPLIVVVPESVLEPIVTDSVPEPSFVRPPVLVLARAVPVRFTFWPFVSITIAPVLLVMRLDQSVPALLAVYWRVPPVNRMEPPFPSAPDVDAASATLACRTPPPIVVVPV